MQLLELKLDHEPKSCRVCCYVIVTGRSLSWTLLSILAFMAVFSGFVTPRWLVSPPRTIDTNAGSELYSSTVGIYNRCTRLNGRNHCGPFNMDGLATDSSVFPTCWKAAYVFIFAGLAVMFMTIGAAILGFCVQSIGRKSIFNLSGVAQAIAGIFYLLGMIMYPAGWSAERVQRLCGPEADMFFSGDCTFGWALYCGSLGVILTFICALISNEVEKSTSSDEVQDKMNEGKNFICLV